MNPNSDKEDITPSSWQRDFLFAYLVFGLCHEIAHMSAAMFLGFNVGGEEVSFWTGSMLLHLILGRQCSIPSLELADDWEISIVRHMGWVASVVLCCLVFFLVKKPFSFTTTPCTNRHPWIQAAFVTALEALATDLFGFSFWKKTTFLCGNFGVIMLNPGWTTTPGDHGKTVLDLLEKMIEITMMRGAQTGGVVTWITNNSGKNTAAKPIRVRVVNGKRTDLSELLRKGLNRQVCHGNKINPTIQCLMGHTRFATSSKATMDGTHPHQWCPAETRSIYPFDDTTLWLSPKPKPVTQSVSNFITHNGDLDFFKVNGEHADLEAVQGWLEKGTGHPMPAPVDSAAIAGLVDLIRSGGCFALSIRFARLISLSSASIDSSLPYPSFADYTKLGKVFEAGLPDFCTENRVNLKRIKSDPKLRESYIKYMVSKIQKDFNLLHSAFSEFAYDIEKDIERPRLGSSKYSLVELVTKSVHAFFDNDLFFTTKFFMKNAVGSFGLMVTCSMDAKSQICIAARGQPMSVAFYPEKGIVCYGSELAAVKAGLMYDNPGGNRPLDRSSSTQFRLTDGDMTQETCRFDLDDLGGEVVLLDFAGGKEAKVTTYQESFTAGKNLRSRITPLHKNEFLIPLTPNVDDQILDDIRTIPRALDRIQHHWKEGGLNRMTAWNLCRKLQKRLQSKIDGDGHDTSVDILVTGCEVSLYLAENFASDLQKSFPKLKVQAISSNKILGVFGQELSVPSVGFPLSEKIPDLKKTIVIIVSHSGGTFAPLAISNLLQSVTKDIFVIASEWDTQIGKQLRAMYSSDKDVFASRVFSTDIGVRPSEPCSLSVCATHQMLTQIFEHISLMILNNHRFRAITGAVITGQDLRVLERCNQENIMALERIIGFTANGIPHETQVCKELKAAGNLWADHILENARAYILSFFYIVGTVTAGYPLITGLAIAFGMTEEYAFYITRFLDSLIYFFLPQINITLIRLYQKRNLLHRMVGRTVVIGDIPWVSQCADAFLSKIFARSYSIAGLNVLSGNPSDHLVHRHTHRIVRGSLLICGRPDGRLTALTSAECSVNLSVNQASSIQSLGGTCESITIGHNPSKLQLTKMDIFLGTHRPKFLCEQILDVIDDEMARKQHALAAKVNAFSDPNKKGFLSRFKGRKEGSESGADDHSILNRSSHSLKGAYLGLREKSEKDQLTASTRMITTDISEKNDKEITGSNGSSGHESAKDTPVVDTSEFMDVFEPRSKEDRILEALIAENNKTKGLRPLFDRIDTNGDGTLDLEEFIAAYQEVNPGLSATELEILFHEVDEDGSGGIDFREFEASMMLSGAGIIGKLLHATNRDEKGLLQVQASAEEYFGADMYNAAKPGVSAFAQAHSQHFSMELYESRIASLQRFVAMCVMFHQMGKKVQDFFPKYSFGVFGYKMNRTHSIMRIATTASPVSGDAVREQMEHLRIKAAFQNAVHLIMNAWNRKQQQLIKVMKERLLIANGGSFRTMSDSLRSESFRMDMDGSLHSPSAGSQKKMFPAVGNTSNSKLFTTPPPIESVNSAEKKVMGRAVDEEGSDSDSAIEMN